MFIEVTNMMTGHVEMINPTELSRIAWNGNATVLRFKDRSELTVKEKFADVASLIPKSAWETFIAEIRENPELKAKLQEVLR